MLTVRAVCVPAKLSHRELSRKAMPAERTAAPGTLIGDSRQGFGDFYRLHRHHRLGIPNCALPRRALTGRVTRHRRDLVARWLTLLDEIELAGRGASAVL